MGLADILIESLLDSLFAYVFNRPKPMPLPQKVETIVDHVKSFPELLSMKWFIHRDIVVINEPTAVTACSIEYRVKIEETNNASTGIYIFLSPCNVILVDLAKTGYGSIDRFYCTNAWHIPTGNEKETIQKTYESIADAYLKKLIQGRKN